MHVYFLEMGEVFGEHLGQGEPDGSIICKSNPQSAVCLRLPKIALAGGFVEDGQRGVALTKRGGRALDRGEPVSILQSSGSDCVARIHSDATPPSPLQRPARRTGYATCCILFAKSRPEVEGGNGLPSVL